jgi:cytochrome c-type biogenesis protein CcmH/NrfG
MLLVVALPIAALWPVCGHDFVSWDDYKTVAYNPSLNPVTWHSVQTWWTTTKMDLYVPVTYTVWGVIALLARVPETATTPAYLNPIPFHIANLVLHMLCCVVVFELLRLLIGETWPAAAGALIFELHPVQVEAVAWVSGLKDVLGGLLALVAIWQYLIAVKRNQAGKSGRWNYTFAMAAFVLAMLAKPNESVAPVVATILDLLLLRRSWRRVLAWLWPWFVLSVAFLVVAKQVQPVPDNSRNVALYLRPLVAIASIGFYVGKLLWPMNLGLDYGLRPSLAVQSPWLVADVVFIGGAAVVLWLVRRAARPMVAGAIVFVAALLPVLGFVTFDFQWYSTVADHYLYLPMFGVALIAAWAAARWSGWPIAVGAAVVIGLLGTASYFQTRSWQDTQSLWVHVADVNPASAEAYGSLSVLALDHGNAALALELSHQAIEARPDDASGYVAAGQALAALHRQTEAMQMFTKALEIEPAKQEAQQGLANVLTELNQLKLAEYWQRQVVAGNPTSAEEHFKLGSILERQREFPQAIAELRVAAGLDPASAEIHMLLVKTLAEAK